MARINACTPSSMIRTLMPDRWLPARKWPPRTCRPASTSPIPTSTPSGCRCKSWPSCGGRRPIWWNEQPPDVGGFGDGGYWVVSKHRDVREVSLRSDVFSSAKKSIVPRYKVTGGGGQIEAGAAAMIMREDPEHTRLRKIISRGFTPRAVERLRTGLGERAQRIAGQAAEQRAGDFVLQVARELPLQAIAGLLGVPLEDREQLFDWSNRMIGDDDPEFAEYDALGSAGEMMWYAMQLAAQKAERPGDDIVTTLIDADADGQLTEAEFGMFVVTLAIAGNETT